MSLELEYQKTLHKMLSACDEFGESGLYVASKVLSLEELANLLASADINFIKELSNFLEPEYKDKVYSALNLLQDEKELKNENKSLSKLIKEIITINSDNEPVASWLKDNIIEQCIKDIYQAYCKESVIAFRNKTIAEWAIDDCLDWANFIKARPDIAANNEYLSEVISVIMQAVKLQYGYLPRDTQLLALIVYLRTEDKKCLAQIATGEGKSIIVAMLAIILALRGEKIDVTTNSSVLALREVDDKKALFNCFGLNVAHNIDIDGYENNYKSCYDAHIVYGDLVSFQWDMLRSDYLELEARGNREYVTIIVDEVDSMFIDGFSDIAIIARQTSGMAYLNIILIAIWQQLIRLEHEIQPKDDTDMSEIESLLKQYVIKLIEENETSNIIPRHLKSFARNQIAVWVENAMTARFIYKINKNYVISKNREDLEDITVVDYENTGVIRKNLIWENGLHQFLQIKHSLPLRSEALFDCFVSNVTYIKKYKSIYGMTGTLGDYSARQFLEKIYQVNLVNIPNFREKHYAELPSILSDNWINDIVDSNILLAKQGRASLIICDSIQVVDKLEESLSLLLCDGIKLKRYSRNDTDEIHTINEIIDSGDIIIATNLAGRGTDIKTSPSVESHGGLHVCLTFLPKNQRVEDQAFGRTSRQGNAGTGQLIVDKKTTLDYLREHSSSFIWEDHYPFFHIKSARNHIEELSLLELMKFELEVILLKDELLANFAKFLNQIRNEHNNYILDDIRSQWSFWLKLWSRDSYIQRVCNKEKIWKSFSEFLNIIRDQIHNDIRENPYELILTANKEINRNKAIELYNDAIELDPMVTAQAYYNRALTRIILQKVNYKKEAICDLEQAIQHLKDHEICVSRATQLMLNLNPEQETFYSPIVQNIQDKIEFYQYQTNHIENIIATINSIDGNLIVTNSGRLKQAFDDFKFSPSQQNEIIQTGLQGLFDVVEEPDEMDWFGAIFVGFLGVLQVVVGAAITISTLGLASPLGTALISEGIGDLIFAVRCALEGHFSWDEYEATKTTSIAISIISMGIDLYKASRASLTAHKTITHQEIVAATKQHVQHTLIQSGVTELLNYSVDMLSRETLRSFKHDIYDYVDKIVCKILDDASLDTALNKIMYSEAVHNEGKFTELQLNLYELIKSSQKSRHISSIVMQAVIERQNKGLGTIFKIIDIAGALDSVLAFTEEVCDSFKQNTLSIANDIDNIALPDEVLMDFLKTKNQLKQNIVKIITKTIMSALHGRVIKPTTHLLLDEKIKEISQKIRLAASEYSQIIEDYTTQAVTEQMPGDTTKSQDDEATTLSFIYDFNEFNQKLLEEEALDRLALVLENDLLDTKTSIVETNTLIEDKSYWDIIVEKIENAKQSLDEWQFTDRLLGASQCVLGGLQVGASIAAGTISAETGIGPILATSFATMGMDSAIAGCQMAWSGVPTPTYTNKLLQASGLSYDAATLFEFGVNINPMAIRPITVTGLNTFKEYKLASYLFSEKAAELKTSLELRKWNILKKPIVYHSKSQLDTARKVFEQIDPKFFRNNSRFGSAFYVSDNGYTTINELAYHGARAKHTICYEMNLKNARILDLTQSATAKQWGYLGGNDYRVSQDIAKQARNHGYNAIRFISERGSGSNLAVIDLFSDILIPKKIIEVPTKQPARFSNPFKIK